MFRCFALIQLDFAIAFVLVNGLLSLVRSGTACSRAPRHVHSSFSNELYYISIWKFVYLLFYSCFIIVASYATRVALLLKLNMHFASGLHVSCAVFRWEKCIVFFFLAPYAISTGCCKCSNDIYKDRWNECVEKSSTDRKTLRWNIFLRTSHTKIRNDISASLRMETASKWNFSGCSGRSQWLGFRKPFSSKPTHHCFIQSKYLFIHLKNNK